MRRGGRAVTLADVRVGASAVLLPDPALDAPRARRLMELGLRPGATVRVMMRTAGGGRVLGVDNLRIVLDRAMLGAIAVNLPRPAARAQSMSRQAPRPPASAATGAERSTSPPEPLQVPDGTPSGSAGPPGPEGQPPGPPDRRKVPASRKAPARRLRLLGGGPGLTAVPGRTIGDGTD